MQFGFDSKQGLLCWKSLADLNGHGLMLRTDWYVRIPVTDNAELQRLYLKVGINKALAMIERITKAGRVVDPDHYTDHAFQSITWEPHLYMAEIVES